MSAMEKMLTDMLMKAIPDEVRGLLTQENLEKLQTNIAKTHSFIIGSLSHLVEHQAAQDTLLADQSEKLEEILEHVRNSNNGKRKREPVTVTYELDSDTIGRHGGNR